jgi:hypothetical protein
MNVYCSEKTLHTTYPQFLDSFTIFQQRDAEHSHWQDVAMNERLRMLSVSCGHISGHAPAKRGISLALNEERFFPREPRETRGRPAGSE